MATGFDTTKAGEQEITITYGDKTFTYTVNVTALPESTPTPNPTEPPKTTEVPGSEEEKGGCGSSSAIAQVMLIFGAALVIKKRK